MRISDWSSDVCSSDLVRMPSSAAARITRIEISPRFATSSLRTGAGETSMEFFLRGAWGTDINRARTDQPVSRREAGRSEERRVGKECVSRCRSRGSPDHKKKNRKQHTTND